MDVTFTETTARMIFALIWIPFAGMRIYFHKLAEAHTKSAVNKDEGLLIGAIRLFVGLPWMASLVLWLVYPAPIMFAALELPTSWRIGGVALFVIGTIGTFWTNYTLGRNFSGSLVLQDDHELVQSGPYRRVRHPMYSFFIVMCLGMLLLSANWLVAGVPLVGVILMMILRTPREEAMMIHRFGDTYQTYMNRTGKFLPRIGGKV